MNLEERSVMQSVLDGISSRGPDKHLFIALKALELIDNGYESFNQIHPDGVIGFYEETLQELEHVAGSELLRAVLCSTLTAEYGKAGQLKMAIARAESAIPILAKDRRLPYAYAQCLHDLGGALYQSGREEEGVDRMKQAMAVFDSLPDQSRGEICRTNLASLLGARMQRNNKPSFWSRLLGGSRCRRSQT